MALNSKPDPNSYLGKLLAKYPVEIEPAPKLMHDELYGVAMIEPHAKLPLLSIPTLRPGETITIDTPWAPRGLSEEQLPRGFATPKVPSLEELVAGALEQFPGLEPWRVKVLVEPLYNELMKLANPARLFPDIPVVQITSKEQLDAFVNLLQVTEPIVVHVDPGSAEEVKRTAERVKCYLDGVQKKDTVSYPKPEPEPTHWTQLGARKPNMSPALALSDDEAHGIGAAYKTFK